MGALGLFAAYSVMTFKQVSFGAKHTGGSGHFAFRTVAVHCQLYPGWEPGLYFRLIFHV
jgi:hypothetical protein